LLSAWERNLTHVIAHKAACEAGVLHRDISVGNILIVGSDSTGGILIDWDLSRLRRPKDEPAVARRYSRTVSKSYEAAWPLMSDAYSQQGTWQFMAADLVHAPNTPHLPMHDLESAFWILMWIALTYMHSNWSVGTRSSFIKETMNPKVFVSSGGQNKLFFMQARVTLRSFAVDQNLQLTRLIRNLKDFFTDYHEENASAQVDDSSPKLDDPEAELTDHQKVLEIFNNALKSPDWPDNDGAQLQYIVPSNDVQISMHSSSKRSREVAEESGVYSQLPSAKWSGTA
jgi:serine/threonine protein kinase